MRCLIDTNIFLEMILERAKVSEAQDFMASVDDHEFFISNYSLHSIGTYLLNKKAIPVFRRFLRDQIIESELNVVGLYEQELEKVTQIAEEQNLDFDDSYQYAIAEKHDLTLVSFDKDFDKTERGRKTPAQILDR